MNITASAISLNVKDVRASADWAMKHLGFSEEMAAEGFCSLSHPKAGFNLIYLATGLPTFKPASAAAHAGGLLVVFTVDDIDADYARLQGEGVDDRHPHRDRAVGRALLPDDRPQRGRLPARPVGRAHGRAVRDPAVARLSRMPLSALSGIRLDRRAGLTGPHGSLLLALELDLVLGGVLRAEDRSTREDVCVSRRGSRRGRPRSDGSRVAHCGREGVPLALVDVVGHLLAGLLQGGHGLSDHSIGQLSSAVPWWMRIGSVIRSK